MIFENLRHLYKKILPNKKTFYTCNICGNPSPLILSKISREEPDCASCGSTLRMRSMIALLSEGLFGHSIELPHFPYRPDIRGIGMSDWDGYAKYLSEKLNYTNTFYHQEPKVDISNPPSEMAGSLDFLLSTDVFEHVLPPIQIAFDNARKLLKPGGLFVLSVPYTLEAQTKEHFPDIHEFEILKEYDQYILKNRTTRGEIQTFNNLVFHGGPGSTLEMRVFSKNALAHHLQEAGFKEIQFRDEPNLHHGIHWTCNWSLPITART